MPQRSTMCPTGPRTAVPLFSLSERDGQLALWTIPSAGGQRLKLNEGGYAPRFSPDGSRLTYWYGGGLWTADPDGSHPSRIADVPEPVFGVWSPTGPVYSEKGRIQANTIVELPMEIWPSFDRLAGGRWLVAALEVERLSFGLWISSLPISNMDFGHKIVVVTGATSGIGHAAALGFARKGATVAGVGRDASKFEDLSAQGIRNYQADLSSENETSEFVKAVLGGPRRH